MSKSLKVNPSREWWSAKKDSDGVVYIEDCWGKKIATVHAGIDVAQFMAASTTLWRALSWAEDVVEKRREKTKEFDEFVQIAFQSAETED